MLAQDVSEGSTGLFTGFQLSLSSNAGGFEQDAPVMCFPLGLQLLGFDDKQARLLREADCLQGRHLRKQVLLSLLRDHNLLFSHLVRRAHLAESLATLCRQSV